MKKYVKAISIVLVVTIAIAGFYGYDKWKYSKVTNIIDIDDIISLSSTYIENEKKVVVNSTDNEVAVKFNNQMIIIPNDKFLEILSKYKSKKSRINYFPYETERITLDFTIVQSKEVKNFLLGDFNIWFESGESKANEIIDGDKLLDELLVLAGQQ